MTRNFAYSSQLGPGRMPSVIEEEQSVILDPDRPATELECRTFLGQSTLEQEDEG